MRCFESVLDDELGVGLCCCVKCCGEICALLYAVAILMVAILDEDGD